MIIASVGTPLRLGYACRRGAPNDANPAATGGNSGCHKRKPLTNLWEKNDMTINKIMSRPIDPIDPTATIAAAAGKMRDEDVSCLLVGRDDRLFGVVTDRHLAVRALAEGRGAAGEPVWTVMSSQVLCCFEDQPVEEAARIMTEHGVRCLPVLDREGVLSGIVSPSDVGGIEIPENPWQVTFYKELADSSGTVHEAPLATVYVAAAGCEDEAAAAAGRLLDEDWCAGRWKGAADGCRVTGGARSRRFQARQRPMHSRESPRARAQLRYQRPNPLRGAAEPAGLHAHPGIGSEHHEAAGP